MVEELLNSVGKGANNVSIKDVRSFKVVTIKEDGTFDMEKQEMAKEYEVVEGIKTIIEQMNT